MAASQSDHDNQPQKEPAPQSSSVPNQPPPPAGYPPAMGYPPGYYQGYNNYPYPPQQAPPPYYYQPQVQVVGNRSSSFVRGLFLGLVFLLVFMSVSSMVTWLVLRPQLPKFHLDALSVSNFSATAVASSIFTANWVINMTVHNPNTKLKVYFDEIGNFVYYGDELLGSTILEEPLYLNIETERKVNAEIMGNNTNPEVEKEAVEAMADEKRSGKVNFNLRMAFLTTFKSGTWWSRRDTLKVYCEDLILEFGNAGGGKVGSMAAGGRGKDCVVLG